MDFSLLKSQIFGQPDITTYIAGFFFVILIALYKKSRKAKEDRDPDSTRTPEKWDWKFFIVDNLRDLFSILTMTFLFFRFSNFFITKLTSKYLEIGNEVDLMIYAVLLGFLSTYIQQGLEILECKVGGWIVKKTKDDKIE